MERIIETISSAFTTDQLEELIEAVQDRIDDLEDVVYDDAANDADRSSLRTLHGLLPLLERANER